MPRGRFMKPAGYIRDISGALNFPRIQLRGLLQHRPAVAVLILIIIGIWTADHAPLWPWVWLCAAGCATVAGCALQTRARTSCMFLGIAVVLIAMLSAQIETDRYPADQIGRFSGDADCLAEVEFRLLETPRILVGSDKETRPLSPKQVALVRVTGVRTWVGWKPASGEMSIFVEQIHPQLRAGQLLRATGVFQRPLPAMNPGQMDWANYYRGQRILISFKIAHADAIRILDDPGPPARAWLREKTRNLLAMGFNADRSMDHALLRAMVLGDHDPMLRDIEAEFARTGTIHLLSVSGLHVAAIGGFALLLLRMLRVSPRRAIVLASAVVAFYAVVALPTWPGMRTSIMWGAAAIGLYRGRWLDSLQSLAVATSGILLYHPADEFNGGFQVSFAAVIGLMLLTPPMLRRAQRWTAPSVVLHSASIQRHRWRTRLWRAAGYAIGLMISASVAWLMSLPLVAYHFGQFSAWSAPAGVVLLPLAILALLGGVAKIGLTLLLPSGAAAWAGACAAPMVWMRHAIEGIDRLPGASAIIAQPAIFWIIAYYAIFLLPMLRWRKWTRRAVMVISPLLACAVLIWSPGVTFASRASHANVAIASNLQDLSRRSRDRTLTVTLLSVGAGQTAIVRAPGQGCVFIDAGSSTISDVSHHLIFPMMRFEGWNHIDQIILSHGDFDHISAAADLFHAYSQPTIVVSRHFARHALPDDDAGNLLQLLSDAHCSPHIVQQGDCLPLGGGAYIDVLWPPENCDMNSNNCGLVLMLHYGGKSVLFPADIQAPTEDALLLHPERLKADVLVAPHHGSAEISMPAFLRAVHPQMILASSAIRLTQKQKHFDAMVDDYPLYRTSRCGAISLRIDRDGTISVETFTGAGPVEHTK